MRRVPRRPRPVRKVLRWVLWLVMMALGLTLLLHTGGYSTAQPSLSDIQPGTKSDRVQVLRIDDEIISPITAEYIRMGIEDARDSGAAAVVIQLDTPGGLLSSTHTIIKTILNAPVPVIVYVSPAGARAGSAGVFITMAGHVAAMHPNSHIGAAHPVDAGGNWPAPTKPGEETPQGDEKKPSVGEVTDVMSEKILNDTVAAMRVLAKSRGRNEDWAVRAVTESASIPADEALEKNVVDILAPDIETLLKQSSGRMVDVEGREIALAFASPQIVEYEFSPRQQILSALTHPLLAYFLLMIGFYAIVFEVTHPGFGLSGIVGIICLILALLGMQAMSINLAGLALIIIGMVMFVIEVFTPTFGLLFLGGLTCLIFGTLLLYQTGEPFLREAIPYIVGIAAILGALTWFLIRKVMRNNLKTAEGPLDKLVDEIGRVTAPIAPGQRGKVRVFGEIWDAEATTAFSVGEEVRVTALDESRRVLKVSHAWTEALQES